MQADVQTDVIQIDSDSDDDDLLGDFYATIRDGNEVLPFAMLENDFDAPIPEAPTQISEPTPSPELVTDPEVLYQLYLDKVLEVFPDICHDHVRLLYDTRVQAFGPQRSTSASEDMSQGVIMQILDAEKYPKQKDTTKKLKRKRSTVSDGERDDDEFATVDRPRLRLQETQEAMLLLWEFSRVPLKFIDQQLKQRGHLYHAYLAVELAERTFDEANPPYTKLKTSRKPRSLVDEMGHGQSRLVAELLAAKKKRAEELAQSLKERLEAEAEAARDRECMERGEMVECQCCFTDTPLPKATACPSGHPFCFECVRSNTKAQVELSRYRLSCMDGSGCKEEFSREEKHRFLDTKMLDLLERLQQQADLRAADVEGLESCPFCDYAAIYPPVEEDKEFRCLMPTCEIISCRLCRLISHIPKTCEEYKKEQGVEERHVLEEAMTKALLKTCPKCGVSIVKEGGCNKMICSKCHTAVCDYCGEDISRTGYNHFNNSGTTRDGAPRKGKGCPPHDDTDNRNKKRIEAAEKEAIAQIRAENPGISEEDLKIKFSESVQLPADPNNSLHRRFHPNLPNYAAMGLVRPLGVVEPPGNPLGPNVPLPRMEDLLMDQNAQRLRETHRLQSALLARRAAHMGNKNIGGPGIMVGGLLPDGQGPSTHEPLAFAPRMPRTKRHANDLFNYAPPPSTNDQTYQNDRILPPRPNTATVPQAHNLTFDERMNIGRIAQLTEPIDPRIEGLNQQSSGPKGLQNWYMPGPYDKIRDVGMGKQDITGGMEPRGSGLPPHNTWSTVAPLSEMETLLGRNTRRHNPFAHDSEFVGASDNPLKSKPLRRNTTGLTGNLASDVEISGTIPPPPLPRRRRTEYIDLDSDEDLWPNSKGKAVVRHPPIQSLGPGPEPDLMMPKLPPRRPMGLDASNAIRETLYRFPPPLDLTQEPKEKDEGKKLDDKNEFEGSFDEWPLSPQEQPPQWLFAPANPWQDGLDN